MFMLGALDKLLSEKNLRKSQNSALRQACTESAAELRKALVVQSEISEEVGRKGSDCSIPGARILPCPPESMAGIDVCKYLAPFELACQASSARLVEIGLDTLQKLVAYGHITDSQNYEDSEGKTARVIDRIVAIVADCFKGDGTSDGVQLQIIKALLTVMTSQFVEVHHSILLLCIKTCFNICLISRNPVNQTTAKATLTQIVNLVFLKMEQYSKAASVVQDNDGKNGEDEDVRDIVLWS